VVIQQPAQASKERFPRCFVFIFSTYCTAINSFENWQAFYTHYVRIHLMTRQRRESDESAQRRTMNRTSGAFFGPTKSALSLWRCVLNTS
jgi:hypothetical protein